MVKKLQEIMEADDETHAGISKQVEKCHHVRGGEAANFRPHQRHDVTAAIFACTKNMMRQSQGFAGTNVTKKPKSVCFAQGHEDPEITWQETQPISFAICVTTKGPRSITDTSMVTLVGN